MTPPIDSAAALPAPERLAVRVRHLRHQRGLSRSALARRAGLTFTELSRIENAAWKQHQRPERVLRLALGLEVPPHLLLRDAFGEVGKEPALTALVTSGLQRLTRGECEHLQRLLADNLT
jgi:transcriptional regulator with XRE-family HTH domain